MKESNIDLYTSCIAAHQITAYFDIWVCKYALKPYV